MSKYSCFELSKNGHIANLILNRPDEFNTMIRKFWVELTEVLDEINKFIGEYKQQFHHYSSIHVKNKITGKRKALWEWAAEDCLDEIDIPDKLIDVKYIKLLDTKQIEFNYIKNEIINTINT